jgi:hypothetical protein
MQQKRFWLSVVSVWFVVFLTDFVFHQVWLKDLYASTAQFWKMEAEMEVWKMWFGNAVFAWAFVWIYTKGITQDNPWHQAFRYALAILLVSKIPMLIGQWGYSALPPELLWKWGVAYFVQATACAFAMTWVFKPNWVPAPQKN